MGFARSLPVLILPCSSGTGRTSFLGKCPFLLLSVPCGSFGSGLRIPAFAIKNHLIISVGENQKYYSGQNVYKTDEINYSDCINYFKEDIHSGKMKFSASALLVNSIVAIVTSFFFLTIVIKAEAELPFLSL